MWHLQGYLLYKSIEHRNDFDRSVREPVSPDVLVPYEHLLNDPRIDAEKAKKIAA